MKRIKLVSKRERWGLTLYGWLLVGVALLVFVGGYIRNVVPFLSVQNTIEAKIMILEGYIPDHAYPIIINIFYEDNYDLIITSGTTFDQGFYISGVETAAGLIRNSLLNLGFDSCKVVAVPVSPGVFKDRTYNSALYTKKYISENLPETKSINIVSLGTHSRRSKYLFKMVYEPHINVGNIVIPSKGISRYNWYKSSRGFKSIITETISYYYVLFFFWPDENEKSFETKS